MTPAGMLIWLQSSMVFCAVRGVSSLGFSTTVFPARRAGIMWPFEMCRGKLKVPKTATTPWGLNRASAVPALNGWHRWL